jgi:hypothetical protein
MITVLIAAAISGSYLAIALFAARSMYGRMRTKSIDGYMDRNSNYSPLPETAVKSFNEFDRGPTMVGALAGGLAWPAVIPLVYVVGRLMRWFDETASKSRTELKAEHQVMQARIRELERELHIGEAR